MCQVLGGVVRVRQGLAALLTAICLQGCTEWNLDWGNRYGPSPTPTAAQASAAAQRELGVIAALAYVTDVTALPAIGNTDAWMEVVLTGFNTVDDACSTYMNDLWRADRQRNQANNVLTATGGAVAAIVGARTNPPGHTLAILAQAFSLSEAISNAVWETYLFSQNASTIRGIVKKTSDAYRNALQNRDVTLRPTPAGAYYHVRE